MATLQMNVKSMMPGLRREVAQKLDPDVMDTIAVDLESRIADVRRENVPDIISKRWERLEASVKAGKVKGLQVTYGPLKSPEFLAQVRSKFEEELRRRMDQTLDEARQIISSRELFRSWPKGGVKYDFNITTPAGNLNVTGQYNFMAIIFNESEFGDEWTAAINKLLASEEHEDLASYRDIEAMQDRIDDRKAELQQQCRKVLRMIRKQP